jgi:hypothetical protein
MADTMEGVVTEADQPKPENVEQKTVAGMLPHRLPTCLPLNAFVLHVENILCRPGAYARTI